MMAVYKHIYTQKGLALMAKLHTGVKFEITRILSGAGKVPEEEMEVLEAICEQKQELDINDQHMLSNGSARLDILLTNRGLEEAYPLNQIGVYAKDPDEGEILYLVLQESLVADMIPSEAQAPGYVSQFEITLLFGNSEQLAVNVDPAGWATKDWIRRLLEQYYPSYELVTIQHHLGCYPQVQMCRLQYGAGMGTSGDTPAGGTELRMYPSHPIYHDPHSLTVKTVRPVVELGSPIVERIDSHRYLVTFEGNDADSIYIELWTGQQAASLPPVDSGIVFTNLRIGGTPPDDPSDVWGVLE